MSIRTAYQAPTTADVTFGDGKAVAAWRRDGGFLWVDILSQDIAATRRWLSDDFGFHPLAISDALRDKHPPKIEFFADHALLIMRGLDAQAEALEHLTNQLAFLLLMACW